MTPEVFASQLDRIAMCGLAPEVIADINLEQPGRHILLSFDDGGKGAVRAADELSSRGWKGHFFITTGLLGSRTFLDAQAARYLYSCGHVLGSHSHTHPDIFSALSFHQMTEEWRVSCDMLSNLVGGPCLTGSVPGGDVSRRVFESADRAGIQFLFTSAPVLVPKRMQGCWILGRVCSKADTPLPDIEKLAEFRGWRRELFRNQVKTTLKAAFPPLYRLYVQRTIQ